VKTKIPRSYGLARFFLRGRLWRWYLNRLVATEKRWNFSPDEIWQQEERKRKIRESSDKRIEAEERRRTGNEWRQHRGAMKASVRKAIKWTREQEAAPAKPSIRCGVCGDTATLMASGGGNGVVCGHCISYQRSLSWKAEESAAKIVKECDVCSSNITRSDGVCTRCDDAAYVSHCAGIKSVSNGDHTITYAEPSNSVIETADRLHAAGLIGDVKLGELIDAHPVVPPILIAPPLTGEDLKRIEERFKSQVASSALISPMIMGPPAMYQPSHWVPEGGVCYCDTYLDSEMWS
jgi:hypothetical protein